MSILYCAIIYLYSESSRVLLKLSARLSQDSGWWRDQDGNRRNGDSSVIVRGSASVARSRHAGSVWDRLRGPWRFQKRRDWKKGINRVRLLLPRTTSPIHNSTFHSDEVADPLISILGKLSSRARWKQREEERRQCLSMIEKSTSDQEDTIRGYFVSRGSAFIVDTRVTLREMHPLCPLKYRKEACTESCIHTTIVSRGEMFVLRKFTESSWYLDKALDNRVGFSSARDLFLTIRSRRACRRS